MPNRFPLVLLALLLFSLPTAAGAAAYDAPLMASDVQGHAKIVAIVIAGPSGAPAGFTIQWMEYSDYLANGAQWYDLPNAVQAEASFTGEPTLNTWDGTLTTFSVPPSGVAAVEVGDLFDETGVEVTTSLDELSSSTMYIFRSFANGDAANDRSTWSNNYLIDTSVNRNCTYTQGFWKNHPEAWSTSLTLGSVTYTQAELLDILHEPARGNGLVILAHQLIATLLNQNQGADVSSIQSDIDAAQALIGSLVVPPVGSDSVPPSSVSSLTQTLDDYNNGIIGPGHCGTVSVGENSWGRTKADFR
ncbi:hypothetical protein K8I85_01640 [bacterium]|nr:hypothetical protein [bacterium]